MSALDGLVRRTEREHFQPGNESHFIHDASTGAFLQRVPLLWAGRLQYYQVVCSRTPSVDARGSLGPIIVQDPSDGTMLRLQIDYEAWIQQENAQDVIRAVAGDNPGQRLAQLVIDTVQRRARTNAGTFFNQFPGRAVELERELELQLLQQCGLGIRLTLRLAEGEVPLPPLPHLEIDVPVHLADFATELTVRLGVVVSVHERDQARAIDAMKRRPHLKDTLRTVCREFFVGIELQRFRAGFQDSLQQALRGHLEKALASWFLRLRTFSLSLQTRLPDLVPFVEEESQCDIEIRGYPRKVSLRTRVQLELADENRYHRAGAPQLKGWVQDNVRDTLQRVLFDVRYSQLCTRFSQWEDRILHGLRAAAAGIGYHVKAQITTPALPESKFQYPFQLELSDQFATAVATVKTGLDLVLRLQLDDLQSVSDELDRGENLEALFKDVVRGETTAFLHGIPPGFLFTRFSQPADHTGRPVQVEQPDRDDRLSVEETLRKRISEALATRYRLRLLAFTVKQGQSQIRDCYEALTRAALIPFEVDVLLRGHGKPVPHHGEVQVEGVADEGWPRFQQVLPTPGQVTEVVTAVARDLISRSTAHSEGAGLTEDEAHTLIHRDMRMRMRAQLGLGIAIVSWARERSDFEDELSKVQFAVHQARLNAGAELVGEEWESQRKEIRELEKKIQRLRLLGNDAEADAAQQRLKDLRKRFGGQGQLSSVELLCSSTKGSEKRDGEGLPSGDRNAITGGSTAGAGHPDDTTGSAGQGYEP
ncbi:hypothetical protein ACLESO_05550 [Pyxidicoccus sp. 3LG]